MGMTRPLEVLRIESPCHESWEAMAGDDARRFCQGCHRHVHNLSAMTRDQAERLICEAAGPLCVRFEQAPDGAVRTLDYAARRRSRGWRFWTVVAACGALLAGVARAFVPGRLPPPPPVVMGGCPAPPTGYTPPPSPPPLSP